MRGLLSNRSIRAGVPVFGQVSVIVDQEQVLSLGYLYPEVVASRESEVLFAAEGTHKGVSFLYHPGFILPGRVVHHNDFVTDGVYGSA